MRRRESLKLDEAAVREGILKRYRQVACSAEGVFSYPTGREGALSCGYDQSVVDRALRPGGRFQFADIVLAADRPDDGLNSHEAWSGLIGGAVPVEDMEKMLQEVGFAGVEFVGDTGISTSKYTGGALFRARKRQCGGQGGACAYL